MPTARPFADMLAQFLTIHLPVTRACSHNTICAYRDAFTLFQRFMDQQQATLPDRVSFEDFTAPNVATFLGWLRIESLPARSGRRWAWPCRGDRRLSQSSSLHERVDDQRRTPNRTGGRLADRRPATWPAAAAPPTRR